MIKNYNQFLNEGLLDKLEGPTQEELYNNLLTLTPKKMLRKSIELEFKEGVLKAIDLGANIFDEAFIFMGVKKTLGIKDNEDQQIIDILRKLDNPNQIMGYSLKYEILNGVKLAVEMGVDINRVVDDKQTVPLIRSVGLEYNDIANYLLDMGADIHINDDETMLVACMVRNFKIVKRLIELGSNVNIRNGWCMDYALKYQGLTEVKFLLYHGFNIFGFGDDAHRFTKEAELHGIDLIKLNQEVKEGKYDKEILSL